MPPAILIADPNRQTRDMTTSLFQALGFRYVWATEDGERTQNFLDADIFDYVLLDGQLPGIQVNRMIAAIRAISNRTRVVVLSQLPQAAIRFPDADLVVGKPLSFELVRQLMDSTTPRIIT
jgi:DNA-binding response OmpR family regulator